MNEKLTQQIREEGIRFAKKRLVFDTAFRDYDDGMFAGFIAGASYMDSLSKWIRVEDGLPTKEDADKDGCVLGWDKIQQVSHKCKCEDIIQMKLRFTHWCILPSPPKK